MQEYFLERVKQVGECIEWTGFRNTQGYGRYNYRGINRAAHRVSWELTGRTIPDGYDVHHLCENKACVKVEHLKPIPHGVHGVFHMNIKIATKAELARRAAVTRCLNGHSFSKDNLRNTRNGHRVCKTCANIRNRKYLAKKRELLKDTERRKSAYKGVYWDYTAKKPWVVHFRVKGKSIHVGRFYTEEEAAWMFDQYALNLIGNDAVTNFAYLAHKFSP